MRYKIPTLPRGRSEKNPKVHNQDNENYSTRCDIDNRLLQTMMRYHVNSVNLRYVISCSILFWITGALYALGEITDKSLYFPLHFV